MGPRLSVALELARALGGLALVPPRLAGYLATAARREAEVRADLAAEPASLFAPSGPLVAAGELRDRPLRLFVSAAEHSGEIHAANWIDALRAEAAAAGLPEPEVRGLGGRLLVERGMTSVGDPGSRAAMGFDGVLAALPFYLGLLRDAAADVGAFRPDLYLPVDSPALHLPLANLVRRASPSTRRVHLVTPQHWGWAPWRVGGYRRAVHRGLSILPFEPRWFARHGVTATYVGHPLLDELAELGVGVRDPAEVTGPRPGGPLALLPGSREGVIRRNLPWMLARVAELQATPEHADLEVVLPHSRRELEPLLRELVDASPARVRLADAPLHDELARCCAAFAVSGTVVLDLLPHRLPTVVVYRLKDGRQGWMRDHLLTVPWFTPVNLLANAEVHPEFAFPGEGPAEEVTAALARALGDGTWRADSLAGQDRAAARLGPPGALARAARAALETLPGLAPGSPGCDDGGPGAPEAPPIP